MVDLSHFRLSEMPKQASDLVFPILFVAGFTLFIALAGNFINSQATFIQFGIAIAMTYVVMRGLGKKLGGWRFIASLIVITIAWDLVMPPYLVDLSGHISQDVYLAGMSSDYFIGGLWQGFGVQGFALFMVTYAVSFALLYLAGYLLFKGR